MSASSYGIGVYTLTEAGRLLGVSTTTIRRWLFGYSYDHHGSRTEQEPLWRPQYGVDQDDPLLGFRDLIEARVVRGLRSMGIGLPTIRECLRRASDMVGDDHPFSTLQFKTDGRRIFLERMSDVEGDFLIDLNLRQHVFKKIVEPSFVDLDFDTHAASRWWLLPNRKTVVLDPARSFGQPIVAGAGIPTARIAQVVKAEGSVERAAQLFELHPTIVRDALAFERRGFDKIAA